MSLLRDLTLQNLEMEYRSSIAHQFARYALGLDYESIPAKVLHEGKRSLLDALGCAVGAFHAAPSYPMCEAVVQELGGTPEATVFGSGMRTNVLNATLINSLLVRFLEYNDFGGGGHNSDCIPSIIAVAEREKAGGQDVLISLIISYELGARFREACPTSLWDGRGWTSDIRGGLTMPPALGRLMGLNEDQIANAIGICASRCLPLGILDANREENTMTKNLRFGMVTYDAILSCMLAKKGFTGPVRVVEGDAGMRQAIAQGEMDLGRMVDFSGWRILGTIHKLLCANATTIGYLLATIDIVKEYDLKPEDIESVRVKAGLREARHTTTTQKRYPRNAETADHSAFYGVAIAIKDRGFGPEAFEPAKFTDPVVLDLIERITVEADPSMPERGCAGISEITTKDGRKFSKRVDNPHGMGDDPLTDTELEEKFRSMAVKCMGKDQIERIFDAVWNVEKLADISELTRLMVFKQ